MNTLKDSDIVKKVEKPEIVNNLEKQNNNIAIKKLKDTITNKYNKLSIKQLLVAEYIVNNIENIPEIKSAVELGKIIGVSSTTVGITLTILNLGSFNSFKSRIKKML